MRTVQSTISALMLSLFLLGGLSAFAPLMAHAGKLPIKIGKPVIVPDPKHAPKKGH